VGQSEENPMFSQKTVSGKYFASVEVIAQESQAGEPMACEPLSSSDKSMDLSKHFKRKVPINNGNLDN
jgi:hypothetical protein